MTTRRRFTADFKATVPLEALRDERTIQEIAAKHKVHPNQVSMWKRQATAWERYFRMVPTRPGWTTRGRSMTSTPRSVS